MKTTTKAGPSYLCARCERQHEKPPFALVGTDEAGQAAASARVLYNDHRKYAEGTEAGEAVRRLRGWLKPGAAVLITIPHVARSGMSRHMRVFSADGELCFTYNIAKALGYPMADRDALRIGGCGMDMTLALVDDLAHVLYPDGYACAGVDKKDRSKGCQHPDPYEYPKPGECVRLPHEKRHRPDGNWTFKRRVL